MIRVLLVDDHMPLRAGTRALLQGAPDIEIVAESAQGDEAIALSQRLRPDVVLLDIRLQGKSGVEVARVLRQDLPQIKVLMLTAYNYEEYVRTLFAIGVDGYLLKSDSGLELVEAVRAVCRGEQVLSAEIVRELAAAQSHGGRMATGTLSDREREVLTLVGQGSRNKEIAQQLKIKTSTVETYISNAMVKLNVHSRAEALRLAIQRGIIVLDD